MKKVEWFILGIAVLFIVLITVVITVNVTIKHQTESVAPVAAEEPVPAVEPAVEEEIPAATPAAAEESVPVVETPPAEEPVPAVEPAVEEDSYTDVLDPYGMYKVPEEWAAERGGLFVERETGLYTVGNLVPRYNLETYGVGYSYGDNSTEDGLLYITDNTSNWSEENAPTVIQPATVAIGDFPVLQVSRNEQLHYFGDAKETLKLSKTGDSTYTIPAGYRGKYAPIIDQVFYERPTKGHTSVVDMDENVVSDVRNLEYGEDYKYEWFEGTDYYEQQFTANCRCYDRRDIVDYKISGELTKFGYVAFDISGLEPGFYIFYYRDGGDAVFEITE